jgi:hypothetical protein
MTLVPNNSKKHLDMNRLNKKSGSELSLKREKGSFFGSFIVIHPSPLWEHSRFRIETTAKNKA